MMFKPVLSAAVLALFAACAHAQGQAPGLWEHSFTMKNQGAEADQAMAEMQKQMAAMSPEQRKQVEQMMAGRGMSVGAGGQGMAVKFCLSKEEAARPAEPKLQEGCTHQTTQRSGNTMKFKFECTKPEPSSGEGEVTYLSDKAYSGNSTIKSQHNGKVQQTSMEMKGKWLGTDCGAIKPRPVPAR